MTDVRDNKVRDQPMTETVSSSAGETEAPAVVGTLMQMISGYWVSQIVRTAVDLSIPDHLATESLTAEEIAERESSDPRTTYRLLRACASLGLVAYEGDRRFSGTPMSELLRSGVPNTLRELALVWAGPSHWRPWERMPEAVRKGGTQIEAVLGTDFFSYLAERPEEAALFSAALAGVTDQLNRLVAATIDTTNVSVAVDVGGATGALVRGILQRNPALRGLNLDLPVNAATARQEAEKDGVADRFEAVGGDFFQAVPAADLYLLKAVLHDWSDEQCVRILRNCRASARLGARAVVVENVIGEIGAPDAGPLADMHMLAMSPGQERDLPEFDALFAASRWRRVSVTPTGLSFTMIELEAV
ncbi:methyltransferase [Streptosporangium sp. 'caverna']|uniref:methyltransferase n=1 Tax=Streptosporangium sp. 'caverna' TaxID=2202249 RepID=UPI0019550502|nr:methyltransferase [Streptosporangium sp. 'caverna']